MSSSNSGKGGPPLTNPPKSDSNAQNQSSSAEATPTTTVSASQEPGFSSRVASSARNLARDVLGSDAGVGASSLTSLLSSAAASSQKGGSLANGSSQLASNAASALSEARQIRSLPGPSGAQVLDEKGKGRGSLTQSDEVFEAFAYPNDNALGNPFLAGADIGQSATANIESAREDGAAVVDLLNDTSNELWHDPATIDTEFNDGAEVSADDLFSTESELIQEVNERLGGPQQHRAPSPTNAMNFHPQVEMLHLPTSVTPRIPDYQENSGNDGLARATPYTLNISSSSKSNGAPVYFHSSHEQRAEWMGQWLSDWDSVLQRYTDDVWGPDQIENVKEARDALEELKSENDESGWNLDDQKAVQRLKMVLGHLRLPPNVPK